VATLHHRVVGFTEFMSRDYIDCFFVHKQHQNQGVGSALMREIETRALAQEINSIYAHVNVTARPFFLHKGFQVVKEQLIELRGCKLKSFLMDKVVADI
jgi:putative acetyltransferase